MSISISKPSTILSPFIKQYWMVKSNLATGKSYKQRIVPSGLMELSFYLNRKPSSIVNLEESQIDHSLLTGQLNSYYEIEISGSLDLFSISFQPQGAMMFFDIPLAELMNKSIAWSLCDNAAIKYIEEQLHQSGDFTKRIKIVEEILYQKLVKKQLNLDFKRMDHCLKLINSSRGDLKIDHLAEATCLSRKQFERVFMNSIGATPKQFLKVVRFQNTIYQKQMNNTLDLTDLTYRSGYYDQSHMINDFRKMSGMVPTEFFSSCAPQSDYFSN